MRWVRTPDRVREVKYVPWSRLRRYDRLHEVLDQGLVLRLATNMLKRGWSGPPLVVYGHDIDRGTLLTGVHRVAASSAETLNACGVERQCSAVKQESNATCLASAG
jgi:hypothetical protein